MRHKAWITGLVGLAIAIGLPATARAETTKEQNKLLAKRAAEADAYRKIAECVNGLMINSSTYVRDFVAESDVIQSRRPEMDGACAVTVLIVAKDRDSRTTHCRGDMQRARIDADTSSCPLHCTGELEQRCTPPQIHHRGGLQQVALQIRPMIEGFL